MCIESACRDMGAGVLEIPWRRCGLLVAMKLIVGLGNPGSEYVGTRHNVGFEVIDEFAYRLGWMPQGQFARMAKANFEGLTFDGMLGLEKVLLLEPLTYMNLSGRSVQAAMAFYRSSRPRSWWCWMIWHCRPARIRMRTGGSSGGHNGLKDIERALGTDQYPRLRIGIDPTPPRIAGKDYVLGRFSTEQRKSIDPAIGRACGAIATWIDKGIATAMNQCNATQAEI
jgi:PTH1 family peptidyl-tRNA hydrolase